MTKPSQILEKNQIEVAFGDPTYHNDFEGQAEEFEAVLADLSESFSDYEVSVIEGNLGHGADWPTIIAVIGGIAFMGKPIKENLEAWRDLIFRFMRWLTGNREVRGPYRCNERAAVLIALSEFSRGDVNRLNCVENITISTLRGRTPVVNAQCDLEDAPEQVYVITIHAASASEVIVVKSTGQITHRYVLPTTDWEGF